MTDQDVLDFCKKGFLLLEGVIPHSTNEWVFDYLDHRSSDKMEWLARDERFIDEVLLHPEVAGVARSLLGENFQMPDWISNHRLVSPVPAKSWHMDAGADFERECNILQVFYIPKKTLWTWGRHS